MAGFPVRSLDEWQRILVEAGLQLAICNQQPSKKLVIRARFLCKAIMILSTEIFHTGVCVCDAGTNLVAQPSWKEK